MTPCTSSTDSELLQTFRASHRGESDRQAKLSSIVSSICQLLTMKSKNKHLFTNISWLGKLNLDFEHLCSEKFLVQEIWWSFLMAGKGGNIHGINHSVLHGQCNSKPTVIFLATWHQCPSVSMKSHWMVTFTWERLAHGCTRQQSVNQTRSQWSCVKHSTIKLTYHKANQNKFITIKCPKLCLVGVKLCSPFSHSSLNTMEKDDCCSSRD